MLSLWWHFGILYKNQRWFQNQSHYNFPLWSNICEIMAHFIWELIWYYQNSRLRLNDIKTVRQTDTLVWLLVFFTTLANQKSMSENCKWLNKGLEPQWKPNQRVQNKVYLWEKKNRFPIDSLWIMTPFRSLKERTE